MASNGGEEDFLDLWSDTDFPSLEQLLLPEDNPMAETLNDGADHPGVSGAQVNNAQAPTQQSAQTAVATPHAQGEDHRKKAKVSDFEQGNSDGALESLTVLNLKPEKTIYMLKKSEAILREGQVDRQTPKFKATSVPFNVLRIGQYEVRPQYQSNLIAKWYYTRKRLIWEVLENFVTKKIEISWSDISGIRVDYGGNVEILEIELSKPPRFYCETERRPKKQTAWNPSSDFTDGQACNCRRHCLEFPRGSLGKNMEQLFSSDSRLCELARRPFPSSGSPFFEGPITDAPQSAPHFINPESVQFDRYLHHQLPPNHSSVPICSADDDLMVLAQEYKRPLANHQVPSPGSSLVSQVSADDDLMVLVQEYERLLANRQVPSPGSSLVSQVSDYNYGPPPLFPGNGTIFSGQSMGHLPGKQIVASFNNNSGKVTIGTSHGHPGYNHNSNPTNMMMASKEPSYSNVGMNFIHGAPPWISHDMFNQDMGHYHSGPGSSSNAPAMDVPSSSSYYNITNYHAGQGSHGEYNNNKELCMNEIRPHHAHAQDGLIYSELVSNHDRRRGHHPQDHPSMAGYNTPHFLPSEYIMNVDEVRNCSCFRGDKPPHFPP